MRKTVIGLLLGAVLLAGCGSREAEPGPSASPTTAEGRYVALGDSYTSGPKIGDPTGEVACQQTSLNYPHLVATRLGIPLEDVSCAGATTSDLASSQQVGTTRVAPQFDALTADTTVVTMSVGANDDNVFGNMVVSCGRLGMADPTGSPCTDAARARGGVGPTLRAYQAQLATKIATAIAEVDRRSPDARVLVVGYPTIVAASGTCSELVLAAGDVPFVYRVVKLLNTALRRAAVEQGAEYVDIWSATRGHDICSSDPWIAGSTPTRPAIAFHPYADEERAAARQVVAALSR